MPLDKPPTQQVMSEEAVLPEEKTYQDTMKKFCFTAVVSIPILLLSLPDYFPVLRASVMGWHSALGIIAALLSLPILVWSGGSLFTGALNDFRNHNANMDTLVAPGTRSAWLYSTIYAVAPSLFPKEAAGMFFDTAVIVIAHEESNLFRFLHLLNSELVKFS
jgi:P-type Cu+ transporter